MINFRTVITDRPKACNFIKNETLTQVFSREFCEIFQTTFFTEYLRATASGTPPRAIIISSFWLRKGETNQSKSNLANTQPNLIKLYQNPKKSN